MPTSNPVVRDRLADLDASIATVRTQVAMQREAADKRLAQATADGHNIAKPSTSVDKTVAEEISGLYRVADATQDRLNDLLEERHTYSRAHLGPDADAANGEARGSWLPTMGAYRAALSGNDDMSGGYLVPPHHLPFFYDALRPQVVVLAASPVIVDTMSNEVHIPKIAEPVPVSFIAENELIPEVDPILEEIILRPKKLAVMTSVSNEIVNDSNPSVRGLVGNDHLRQVAIALDNALLAGDGIDGRPLGFRNMVGSVNRELGAGDGAEPTLDDVLQAIEDLESTNATPTAIFMAPRTWFSFRRLLDADDRYQLAPDPTADHSRRLFGIPVHVSSQIAVDETTGANSDTSWFAVVDMNQVVLARRQDIRLEMTDAFRFNRDQTSIRTTSRWDIAPINPTAVHITTGVRPAA